MLACPRKNLNSINGKLDEIHKKFTGPNLVFWTLSTLLSSPIYDTLKDVAAAVEPFHKHLEDCNIGTKSLAMQHDIPEATIGVKGTVGVRGTVDYV